MTESQDTEAPASLIGLELEVLDKRDELEQEKLGDASSTDTRLVRSDSEDADLSMLGIGGEHVVLGARGNYPFPKGDGVIQPYNVNPFLNEAACMVQEWFRCCVVAFTIFPLRLAVLLLSLVVGFLTVSIAGLGFEKNSYNPARGVAWIRKEVLLKPIRLCARGVLFAFGFWWIEQLKEEDDDQEGEAAPVMVVASHSSLFDMLYFVYGWQPMFICDAAMKDVPVLGRCAYLMDAIFVDRYDETSRREALISIDQRLAYGATVSGNKRPRKILFFPEGSWTNGQCLISFKTAAFRLGFPVLPFALEYPHQNLNIAGVGRAASCIFMVRIMLQVYNRMRVRQLKQYTPSDAEINNPLLFSTNVRAVIAQSLGLEVTEHSYEDSWLMADTAGCGYHLRNAAATFDVATVQRQCDISFEYLWKQLRVFQGLKLDMSGRLGFSGFIEATELDDGPYARNLFCFLDVNQSSHVTFIEFVQRLSVIRNKRAYHHRLQLAYLLCNISGSGILSTRELVLACERSRIPEAKRAECVDSLKRQEQLTGVLSFEGFTNVMDKHRDILNYLIQSSSNPLLHIYK